MQFQEIIEKIKPDLKKVEDWFSQQLLEIRIERIGASLVEGIKVSFFGQEIPLKQLGVISFSGKETVIQLWDKSYLESVIAAIEKRKMNIGIRTEENKIFLSTPLLTEETKKDLVKILNERQEQCFQRIRYLRDQAWKELQKRCQESEISEDNKYRGKEQLEKLIKESRKKIETLVENKKKEIQ